MAALEAGLVARVRGRLALDVAEPTRARVAAAARDELGVRGDADVLAVVESLRGELLGAGPLEPLLREPGVTDVLVNGPGRVWVDRGEGLQPAAVRFTDDGELRRLAVRLAASAGRRLDDAMPCADVRLAGGIRLHAVLPPIASGGVCLSFRVPRRRPFTLAELVALQTMPVAAAELLDELVHARLAFLVTGGTGSGKTTVLASLLGRVEAAERIVLIEDSAELNPDHPHVVRLEARMANVEGAGAIGLHTLVREALRMRPDRIVVGEVRGAECVDLLAALNVGHDGGAGTLHANSAADVPARIEALCTVAGLGRDAVHSQLAAGLQVVVHLRRDRSGRRLIEAVGVFHRGSDGLVRVIPAWFDDGGHWVVGPGRAALDSLLLRRSITAR
jgi:pilus assembly protein CpaF